MGQTGLTLLGREPAAGSDHLMSLHSRFKLAVGSDHLIPISRSSKNKNTRGKNTPGSSSPA